MITLVAAYAASPPLTLPEAVDRARAAAQRTGWDEAVGPFTVQRSTGPPRGDDRETQILADATLAWFSAGDRILVITDAALEGAHWRGGADREAESLVAECPGKLLPTQTLDELVLHELGHGALLSPGLSQRFANLENWSAIGGWEQAVGRDRGTASSRWKPATGYRGSALLHEWPEIAIRLCKDEPRGDGAYRTTRTDFVSGYARVDPLEDMAESFRLFHHDPAALAALAPAKYLALATPSAWGGREVSVSLEVTAIRPGLERLLAVAPEVGLEVLRVHAEQLRPAIDALAREPFVWSDEAPFDPQPFQVVIEGSLFRPNDAFFTERAEALRREFEQVEEWEKGIDKLRDRAQMARVMPLVVSDAGQLSAVERAVRDFWPDSTLQITERPSVAVPRFELTYDTLFWITADGVHQREITSPDTAVLLARSWVLTGPPTDELGWVPTQAVAPNELPDDLPADLPQQRKKLADDVWLGIAIRAGAPSRQAVPGLATLAGLRKGPFLAQLQASSRLKTISRNDLAQLQSRGIPVIYDTRYGVGLQVGAAQSLALGEKSTLEGFLLVGTELQEFVRVVLLPPEGDTPTVDPSTWDFGFQFGAGTEIRHQQVGLRASALLDLRARGPGQLTMGYATVALAFHP